MGEKLYAAVIVTVPDDDYAYGNIVAVSEEKEKATELGRSAVPEDDDSNTYLVVLDIPRDRLITAGTQHEDVSVYHHDEESGGFVLTMTCGGGKSAHYAGYNGESDEAESAALQLFGWE